MNILLIGGAGLIGSRLEKLLAADGNKTVVLDNFTSSNSKGYIPFGSMITGNSTLFSSIKPVFSSFSPDVIFHFANCDMDKNGDYDFILESQNKVGTCYSILQCLNLYDVKYIFYGSSCEVFSSPGRKKLNENSPANGFSYTGKTNSYVEKFFEEASKFYKFNFIPIRYFQVSGERYLPNAKFDVISTFVDLILNDTYFDIFGPDLLLDVLDVDAAVEASYILYKSVIDGTHSGPINIGSGESIKLIDLFHMIGEEITTDKLSPGKRKPKGSVGSFICDNSAIRSLGWENSRGLKETIQKVIQYRKGLKNG